MTQWRLTLARYSSWTRMGRQNVTRLESRSTVCRRRSWDVVCVIVTVFERSLHRVRERTSISVRTSHDFLWFD